MSRVTKPPSKRRLVVVDCETNGLFGDVRILSLAMVELRNGITHAAATWTMNPGNVPMDPGARAVNGLTFEMLRDSSPFALHADEIRWWLTAPRGERLTLIGHQVAFDARQLFGEFTRLGESLPSFDLLDTARLARAAGVAPDGKSLDALLRCLGLANSAPHTALGDTTATASAALAMLETIAATRSPDEVIALLNDLAQPYSPTNEPPLTRSLPTAELSEQHVKAHLIDLADGRRRRRSLDVCLAEDCDFLAVRMEDGIISPEHATQVIEWALGHLEGTELPRATAGQVLRGLGRALERSEDPALVVQVYRERLVAYLNEVGRCERERDESCAACLTHDSPCDFELVLRRCVEAYLNKSSSAFARPVPKQVESFLPGYNPKVLRSRGRPAQGFYGELCRNGHLDAAGYGVARVAEVRRVEGGRPWAHVLLNKAWRDGSRNPQMIEMLASMTVVDGLVDGVAHVHPKAPLKAAIRYIVACRRAHNDSEGPLFDALKKREDRLRKQVASKPRPPRDPEKARNLRSPHSTMLTTPLTNTAIAAKPERKVRKNARQKVARKGSRNKTSAASKRAPVKSS
jgi:DNA polymerase III epsilon subunit-like protein